MAPVYKLSASSVTGRTTYGSMLAGNPVFVPTSYESIATVTVGSGGTADVEFTSIPSTYTHLQIRFLARTTRSNSGNGDAFKLQFNNDTGANYSWHHFTGDGSAVNIGAIGSTNQIAIFRPTDAGATASVFGVGVVDILDYENTNKNKVTRHLGAFDNNGSGQIYFGSGAWYNTSAITSIKLTPFLGDNISQYSHFALYGIKGAA